MGIFPKYRKGEIVIEPDFVTEDGEHLLFIEGRHLSFDGLKPSWFYTGRNYIITSTNPIEIKYSTTPARVSEKSLKSLASRLTNPCNKK